jgi:hypothetical protein
MPRLMFLIPVLAMLGGCSESLYYETRYIPTDIESTYSVSARASWSGDREVYELPAAPPDLASEAAPRQRCAYPYQKFKPVPIVSVHPDDVHSSTDIGQVQYGSTDTRVHPSGPTVPLHEPPNFATDSRPGEEGIPPALMNPKIGMTDVRPHSTTGKETSAVPPVPYTGWNENFNPYCCGNVAPTTPSPATSAAPSAPAAAPAK